MPVLNGTTFKVVATGVVGMLGLLLLYAYLGGVSKMDVSYKHEMGRHVVAEPFEAGDVVALSPDGQRVSGFLCDVQPANGTVRDSPVRARYYNVVDESQDRFFAFVTKVTDILGLGGVSAAEAAPGMSASGGVPFVGHVSRKVGSFDNNLSLSCMCAVAEAVVERREVACVVEKALVETELSTTESGPVVTKTVGITFREEPIQFSNLEALAPHCPSLNTQAVIPANQSCQGRSGFTRDTMLRVNAGLIREAALP